MNDENGEFMNMSRTLARFVTGYNKSVVQTSITSSSYGILNDRVERMKNSLESIVAAFEEIRATSTSTEQNSGKIDKMMNGVLTKNAEVGEGISRRVDEISRAALDARGISRLFEELAKKSRSIEKMTGQIQDVSDRTNILAINALIEAARAGSVGKGFRIIANEVRTLAGQTGNFAKEISETINEFGKSVDLVSGQMSTFLVLLENFNNDISWIRENFQDNALAVNSTGESLAEISGAIREQTQALNEGLGSLEKMFEFLQDSHAIFSSLTKAHSYLDKLLNEEA